MTKPSAAPPTAAELFFGKRPEVKPWESPPVPGTLAHARLISARFYGAR